MLKVESLDAELRLLSLDRPERRNALDRPLIDRLADALAQAGSDAAVHGVVLAGAGPSFCAGVDLHEFATASPDTIRGLIGALKDLCALVRGLPKPVACAIQGHCLGGALELAACCDFRVCAADAQLGMPEVFLGIPSVIDAAMLRHHVGAGRAHELLLTGEPISGSTAHQWGLVNALAAPEHLVETAAAVLRRATRHAPEVVAAQKRLDQQWLDLSYQAAVDRSVEPLLEAFRTGRPQRLAAARLEHR